MATLPSEGNGPLSGPAPGRPPDDEASASDLVPRRRSTVALMRDVLVSLTRVAEDSTELVGASVREELARFRDEMARNVFALTAALTGVALLTSGLAMFLNEVLLSWPLTLCIFGAVYLAAGIVVHVLGRRREEGWK